MNGFSTETALLTCSSGRDKICMVWDLKTRESKRTVPVYEVKLHFIYSFEILCLGHSPTVPLALQVPIYCAIRFLSLVLSQELKTLCVKLFIFFLSLLGVVMPGQFEEIHSTSASVLEEEGRTVT